eukprot:TRINITY_DN8704_c0_g3_i2.p1 TRINITY_DN8704_c0_g3~~TRINITY_DN8704_c0_g3_i2.p1  ORF type:complete len:783 (+),score=188.51 TRINITY_DN8704_c0_g3_i2:110-2458(+)
MCYGREIEDCRMLHGQVLKQTWAYSYIGLGILTSAQGAFTVLTIMNYLRYVKYGSSWYWAFVVIAGLALAMNTVWSMHFIGMEAINLVVPSSFSGGASLHVPIEFDVPLTVLSAIIPCILTPLGVHMVTSRNEVERTKFDAASVNSILKASFIVSCAICTLHYLGMESEVGAFTRNYTSTVAMVMSWVIAFVAVTAGFCMMLFLPSNICIQFFSSLLIAVAVNGMHYTGMSSATYYANAEHIPDTSKHTFHFDAMLVAFVATLFDLVILTVCHHYGTSLRLSAEMARMKQEEELNAVSKIVSLQAQFQQMTQSLLSALCDAVVTLGPDLAIAHPTPKLNALLLRNSTSMEGTSFLSLIAPDDRERFQQFVASFSSSLLCNPTDGHKHPSEPAQAITVHFLDGFQSRVQVQLFHTCLADAGHSMVHLLGVCEIGDFFRHQQSGGDAPRDRLADLSGLPKVDKLSSFSRSTSQDSMLDRSSEADALISLGDEQRPATRAGQIQKSILEMPKMSRDGDMDDSRSVMSATLSEDARSEDFVPLVRNASKDGEEDVAVWFDALSFEILKCTTPFSFLSGPIPSGSALTDWLVHADELVSAVQQQVNAIAYDGDAELRAVRLREGLLIRSRGLSCGFEYASECALECTTEVPGDDIDPEVEIVARIVLTNVKQRLRKAKGGSKSGGGSRHRGSASDGSARNHSSSNISTVSSVSLTRSDDAAAAVAGGPLAAGASGKVQTSRPKPAAATADKEEEADLEAGGAVPLIAEPPGGNMISATLLGSSWMNL